VPGEEVVKGKGIPEPANLGLVDRSPEMTEADHPGEV